MKTGDKFRRDMGEVFAKWRFRALRQQIVSFLLPIAFWWVPSNRLPCLRLRRFSLP
jgi:hypothetical protein